MVESAKIIISTPKSEEILQKKEFEIKMDKKSYKLIALIDNSFINFKLTQIGDNSKISYENKYNFNEIANILELNLQEYNTLEKIFELISKSDIKINIDNKNNINLILNLLSKGNKHKIYKLVLNKPKLSINEKFDIIIKTINNIKSENKNLLIDEEFLKLQNLLNQLESSINKKFEINRNKLNSLKNIAQDYEIRLNKNKKNTLDLKNEVKKIEEKYKINDNINNNNSNNNYNNNSINKKNDIIKKENKCIEEVLNVEKLYGINHKYSIASKIILIGDSDSGKTWILDSYLSRLSSNFSSSGINIDIIFIKINNTIMKITITDLPGAEKYFSIAKNKSNGQDLIIFVYAINNYNSFSIIKERIKIIKQNNDKKSHYILVGSKADLENDREVSYDDGQILAEQENFELFVEVSAKMNFYIDELFGEAIKIIYRNN